MNIRLHVLLLICLLVIAVVSSAVIKRRKTRTGWLCDESWCCDYEHYCHVKHRTKSLEIIGLSQELSCDDEVTQLLCRRMCGTCDLADHLESTTGKLARSISNLL